jgi:hypothetical protein
MKLYEGVESLMTVTSLNVMNKAYKKNMKESDRELFILILKDNYQYIEPIMKAL